MRFIQFLVEQSYLTEVAMNPSAFKTWVNSPLSEGVRIGIEFEIYLPGSSYSDEDDEYYDNLLNNTTVDSISSAVDFFESYRNRLHDHMNEDYSNWFYEEKLLELVEEQEDDIVEEVKSELENEYDFDEALEKAAEELEIEDIESEEVIKRAEEIKEEEITDMIKYKSSEYDEKREEFEQRIINDSFYDYEDDWLSYVGLYSMADVQNKYNAVIDNISDYYSPEVSGTDKEYFKQETAEMLTKELGFKFRTRESSDSWHVKEDLSLEDDYNEHTGLEIATNTMPLKEGLEKINKFMQWANDNDCITDDSTGLHINVSVPNFSVEELDYIKLALFIGDQYILNYFGREYNTYTVSALGEIQKKIKTETASGGLEGYLDMIKANLSKKASQLILKKSKESKYSSINVKTDSKNPYVEFRSPGGDYLSKGIDDVINTVIRFAMGLKIATTDMYKQEYYKKLYKLLSPSIKTPEDNKNIALFTQYQSGLITLQQLKQQWAEKVIQKPIKQPTKATKVARNILHNPNEPLQTDVEYDI